jgi:hypothetical protein
MAKLLSKPSELFNASIEISNVAFGNRKDPSARCAAGPCDLEDLSHIVKGEPQALRLANEPKLLERSRTIVTISAGAPFDAGEEAQALVIADCLRFYARSTREFPDQHCHLIRVHLSVD